ncbi:MAG: leucine-rich repeat domain-containing protein, partial [Pirellulaceae bacterium]|nr:leucine-rich repeat domain-containing protein [Pirellulaceae bacterium]
MAPAPKRRWYQFSLKTLLLGMTVLCLGPGGYVVYEQGKARRQKAAVAAIEKLGGKLIFDERVPIRSAAIRQILGDDKYEAVVHVQLHTSTKLTDGDLAHLARLTKLTHLYLNHTQITSTGLAHLTRLKGLTELWLSGTQVTDTGLVHLDPLKGLAALMLNNTQVTDAGLVHLADLNSLTQLQLDDTQVTDSGMVHLARLKGLA